MTKHPNYDLFSDEDRMNIDSIKFCSEPYMHNGEIIGYPFNLIDAIAAFGKEIIPDVQGIYHLFYKDMLVYVGMSKNLRGRLLQHMKDESKVFQNVLWFCCEKEGIAEILEYEYKMIKKFKPSLNVIHANCK
jgi:predicted GIY-YIG superfamily endonuclease